MEIQRIHAFKLRNDEYFQFLTEVKDLVDKTDAEILKIKPLYDRFVLKVNEIDVVLKQVKGSAFTKLIHDIDKKRDDMWSGIVDITNANLKHFDIQKHEAARRFKMGLDTHGKQMYKKRLNEQTTAIHNAMQDFNTKYAADIATLGLGEWVVKLNEYNIQLDNFVKERYEEAALKPEAKLKDLRADADEIFYSMSYCVNAYILAEGKETYADFVKILNAIIAKYNVSISRHHHNHHHGHHGETSVETETPPETSEDTEDGEQG